VKQLFLILLAIGGLSAQEFRGTILGCVTDATNAVAPNATITATNTATNTAVTVQTGADGSYLAPFLIPGPYRVTAEAAGSKKAVWEGIEVRVQDRLSVDFALEVGATSDLCGGCRATGVPAATPPGQSGASFSAPPKACATIGVRVPGGRRRGRR
jgi:hypothetical protein